MKALFLLLLFSTFTYAQQPDRWKGLIIDQSTAEDAIGLLGQPKSDKSGERLFLMNDNWFTKNVAKKLRIMRFENIEGFPDVKLGFDSNSKLVLIHLEPKKIAAQAFVSSYSDVEFRFGNEVTSPADFKHPRDDTDKPRHLASSYELAGATDKVIILAGVGNAMGSVMSGMAEMMGGRSMRDDVRQSGRSTPGEVFRIQLISRTLENRDGAELLK